MQKIFTSLVNVLKAKVNYFCKMRYHVMGIYARIPLHENSTFLLEL